MREIDRKASNADDSPPEHYPYAILADAPYQAALVAPILKERPQHSAASCSSSCDTRKHLAR